MSGHTRNLLIHFIRHPKKLLAHQFPRFLLVGVLNTLFGYLVFALSIYVGVHYALAIAVSTILGTLFNFKTIGVLVFQSHQNSLIFKFFGVYTLIYFLNLGGLISLHNYMSSRYIAQAILTFPLALVSFYLNRKFVFKSVKPDE